MVLVLRELRSHMPQGKTKERKEGRKKTRSNQRSSTTHCPCLKRIEVQGFPSGSVVNNLSVNAGGAGSIPGVGKIP